MLPNAHDIKEAAIGCWEIVRGNARGAERFDMSVDGFWRSFSWAAVLAIFDALDILYGRTTMPANEAAAAGVIPVTSILIVGAISSVLTFCAFPLVVAALAQPMSLTKSYVPFIIVRNWLVAFLSLPVYLIDGFNALGLLDDGVRGLLVLALIVITLAAGTITARMMLGTAYSLSFGFAALDFLLALLISEAAFRLIS